MEDAAKKTAPEGELPKQSCDEMNGYDLFMKERTEQVGQSLGLPPVPDAQEQEEQEMYDREMRRLGTISKVLSAVSIAISLIAITLSLIRLMR